LFNQKATSDVSLIFFSGFYLTAFPAGIE